MNSEDRNNHKAPYEKKFVVRNSLLTDLFDNNHHIRTVYNFVVTIFIAYFVNTTIEEYLKNGQVTFGVELIKRGFRKFHVVAIMWLSYFLMQCCVYFFFKVWAKNREFGNRELTKFWDWFWISLMPIYYVSSFTLTYYVAIAFKVSLASAGVLTTEQTRFLMKSHSFIRNSTPKVLSHKPHSDKQLVLPNFSSFVYFLVVPTLLYRESYPRKDKIDWSFVVSRFLEGTTIIFFLSFIISKCFIPRLQEFGIRKFTIGEIALILLENSSITALVSILIFVVVFHSTQNFFAEITRFGDRKFYDEWWTATDFSAFFRKWNTLVQDWLYFHVYKDFKQYIWDNSTAAKFAVFGLSALVHEWAMLCVCDFFMPLFFMEFIVFGFLLSQFKCPKTNFFNIFFIYLVSVLVNSLLTMYMIEFYARSNTNALGSNNSLLPRFLTCDCIQFGHV